MGYPLFEIMIAVVFCNFCATLSVLNKKIRITISKRLDEKFRRRPGIGNQKVCGFVMRYAAPRFASLNCSAASKKETEMPAMYAHLMITNEARNIFNKEASIDAKLISCRAI